MKCSRTGDVRRSGRSIGAANEIQLKALERELHRLRGILEKELGQRSWRDSARQPGPWRRCASDCCAGFVAPLPVQSLIACRARPLDRLWRRRWMSSRSVSPWSTVRRLAARDRRFRRRPVWARPAPIARLAARDLQRHGADAVGLITLDSYRIGAQEQLASFADMLGLPMRPASDHAACPGPCVSSGGRCTSTRRAWPSTIRDSSRSPRSSPACPRARASAGAVGIGAGFPVPRGGRRPLVAAAERCYHLQG
jgi:hypothetical protein